MLCRSVFTQAKGACSSLSLEHGEGSDLVEGGISLDFISVLNRKMI